MSRPTDRSLFLPLAQSLSLPLLFALPLAENLEPDKAAPYGNRGTYSIDKPPRRSQGLFASTSKINLKTALRLQIVGIERDFVLLLFGAGLDKKRIAEIIIMQMKGDFIVPVAVGPYRLTDRHPRIFDQYFKLGIGLPVFITHKPFNGKPMVGFMCGKND